MLNAFPAKSDWISRPAMDRLAQSVVADGKERPNQWVGVIPISRASHFLNSQSAAKMVRWLSTQAIV